MSIGDSNFGVQVGIGVVGRVITAVVAFLGSVLLARVLGPSRYGSFYLLVAIVAFLDNPITGWATACRKRLTETDFPSGEAIGTLLIGVGITSLVVGVVFWLAAGPLESLTGNRWGWLLGAALFIGMIAYKTSTETLKATARFGSANWIEAAREVIRVVGQSALVLLGFGVAGMVGGMVVATVVVAPIALLLVGVRPSMPTTSSIRGIWSYARYTIPSGFLGTAQDRMDLLLLGFLVGPGVAGQYEVAIKLTIPAMFVAGVARNGLMGRISNLRSRDQAVTADIENNLAYASIIGIPLAFGALVMAGPVVVTTYSNQYAAAGTFLVGLALFRALRSQKVILLSTLNGLDRPDLNLRVSAGVFVLNLCLGVALLFTMGPIGVVAATVVSELLAYGSRAYYVRSLLPAISLVPRPLLEQLIAGALMACVVWVLRVTLPLSSWFVVIGVVGLGGVTYFVTLLALSASLRRTVRAVARDAGID